MTYKMCLTVFIASLSLALTVDSNESFARSGAGAHGGKSGSHASGVTSRAIAASLRHNRNAGWGFWPTTGGVYVNGQPSSVEPNVNVTGPATQHITYTYDVPWDAVHRYPPVVRVHETEVGCRSETITVPRDSDGKNQSVNIVSCY